MRIPLERPFLIPDRPCPKCLPYSLLQFSSFLGNNCPRKNWNFVADRSCSTCSTSGTSCTGAQWRVSPRFPSRSGSASSASTTPRCSADRLRSARTGRPSNTPVCFPSPLKILKFPIFPPLNIDRFFSDRAGPMPVRSVTLPAPAGRRRQPTGRLC